MSAPPDISTARLRLRAFTFDDAQVVERLAGEWAIADTTEVPHPYPPGAGSSWIATHAGQWEARERLTLAVTRAADAELVGAISLRLMLRHAAGEVGYWIGVPYWHNGYATEAARALVRFGFESLGLNRVQGRHLLRNPASGRVLEKLGMTREGVLRQAIRRNGRFEDVVMLALLASDARAKR
jgi:[ribosomal protein S5]-alanine N-acetyltransferase